jgi:rfaE bifunctional protein nucleotidyltransferase chain/domain
VIAGAPIVDRTEAVRRVAGWRSADPALRLVLANGCFELLHVGHLRYLVDARSLGDRLIVALNTDRSVRANKGPERPLVPFEERAELLAALSCVDLVCAFDEPTLEPTLRALVPDVHAKGSDYTPQSVPERGVDQELGIEIAICGDPKDHSTTGLLARLRGKAEAR